MTLAPGALQQLWTARCTACRKAAALETAVTRDGARMALEGLHWTEGPRGWACAECRAAAAK